MTVFKIITPRICAFKTSAPKASFTRDQDGTAAMEFGLLAPLIIGLYLGLAELSIGMAVDRQVSHSASVAGDLATQAVSLDADEVANIMSATLQVAGVGTDGAMTIRLESYRMDPDGTVVNLGTATFNPEGADRLDEFKVDDLGDELLSVGSGVVVARVAYPYQALGFGARGLTNNNDSGDSYLSGTINMSETFMLKPRRSTEIEIGGEGTTWTCSGARKSLSCS